MSLIREWMIIWSGVFHSPRRLHLVLTPLHTMACLCSRPGWVLHLIRAVITWMTISLSRRLSPMSDIAGDLQRRLANLVRRGVIHSVRHDRIPKCRVDLGDIITTWLPLCQGFSGANRADSNPYAVGDAVTVLSEAGELNNGRVFPGWNTGKLPVPEGSDSEHITRYSDGTEIRYDRNAHALTITLADGGTYKIVGKGTLDGPVEITDTLTVQGKTWINADTSVAGNIGASKEITDKSGSMSKIREVFNNHDHRGDSGGLTDKPNQKM
nr:MAG TPA_asm: baseplate assembly protein V [Caudoviricetes sp.]